MCGEYRPVTPLKFQAMARWITVTRAAPERGDYAATQPLTPMCLQLNLRPANGPVRSLPSIVGGVDNLP
jgi:hypothetical protein